MTKPQALPVIPENIPSQLIAVDRWVVWRYELRKGKWAKPPRQTNDRYAASNDSHTWTSFGEALAAYESGRFDGIGIVLPDGIVGIDLDDCVEGDRFTEESRLLQAMLPTYCERSPSGTGVKLLAAGHLSAKLAKTSHAKGVELYDGGDTNRYFTITGQVVDGAKPITGQRESLFAIQTMITEPISERVNLDSDPEKVTKAYQYLEHIKAERADNYDEWLAVGMALSWCDKSDETLEKWLEWSAQSAKFEEDLARSKWESFRRENGRVLTLGYLERLAKEDGYNPDRYQTGAVNACDLLGREIVREYLINDVMVVNEPMVIGGASKSLKTSIALEMALSIATGTPFLDTFEVKQRKPVMFISGESGAATIQENLQHMADRKGLTRSDLRGLNIGFKLPKLDDLNTVEDILEELRERETDILFIDPLYRSLRVGDSASNVYAMGAQLELIAEKINRAGITVILLHHFRKQGKSYSEPPELEDLSQSGIAEFGRQFLLLKRRAAYEWDGKHSLYFSWGGSAGHQGLRMLDVYTGVRQTGLTWQTTLRTAQEWEATQKEKKALDEEGENDEIRDRILEVLGGNPGINTRELCTLVGGRKALIVATLERLEYGLEVNCEHGPRNVKKWFMR